MGIAVDSIKKNLIHFPLRNTGGHGMIFLMTEEKTVPPEFMEWLDTALRDNRLSDSEASRQAGLSHNAIYEIRSGMRPGVKKVRALARLFKAPEEYVFRLAGHLSNRANHDDIQPQADASLEEIRDIVMRLPPDLQDEFAREVLNMARGMERIRRTAVETENT